MRLLTIETGFFKLDGGAMFGIVPKSIWNKLNKADENNMCTWAMRCMLIEDGDKLTLIDTGIGDKQNEKFFSYYYLHGDATLEKSLNKHGYSAADITDVLLTHLHFDHCGGAVKRDSEGNLLCSFPNATYHTFEQHWIHAVSPNQREQASFIKENFEPIAQNGQLNLIKENNFAFSSAVTLHAFHGHTDWMMVPVIKTPTHTVAYCADLIPSSYHLNPVYGMGYDIRPLDTIEERKTFEKEACDNNYILFYEHDPVNECSVLKQTERGYAHDQFLKLSELS